MSILKTGICCMALMLSSGVLQAEGDSAVDFRIEPRSMKSALTQFGEQTGLQIMFSKEAVGDLRSQGVVGAFTPEVALKQLIANSGLRYEFVNERTVRIWSATTQPSADASVIAPGTRLTQIDNAQATGTGIDAAQGAEESSKAAADQDAHASSERKGIPEILVKGSKILNMDIRRSRDDTQPYTVFERETIERSGATNLEDFLKQRLTMNTVATTPSQAGGTSGSTSQINLRGLGINNTLILVDGHRTVGAMTNTATPLQPDINGIPLAAVERVEVLPTTASGIYGGAATGGVVNIVLRRDYSGMQVKLNYENSFESNTALRRVDLSAGVNFNGDKTNLLLGATLADQNDILAGERDLIAQGRRNILRNNPGFYLNGATPVLGATPNIRSVNGSPLFGPGTSNITFVPAGYAGGGGLTPLRANAGTYNFALADTAQFGGGALRSMVNNPTNTALMLTLKHEFMPRLQGFIDIGGTRTESHMTISGLTSTYVIDVTAPNNPFGQSIRVTAPVAIADGIQEVKTDSRRIVGGLIAQLAHGWQAAADYTWQETAWSQVQPPFGLGLENAAVQNGSIDILRDTLLYPPVAIGPFLVPLSNTRRESTMKDIALRVSGPIFTLPAGVATLSGSLEHRDEFYGDGYQSFRPDTYFPSRNQQVSSAYLETKLPLFSRKSGIFLNALELQLAGRWDEYRITGGNQFFAVGTVGTIDRPKNRTTSIDPTVGLRYQPVTDVVLRASFGTGFLPPSVAQLNENATTFVTVNAFDPRRANAPLGIIRQRIGGNPDLKPESSESVSAGVIFTPRVLPGLRLSVDWTRIEKTDNITAIPAPQVVIDNEAFLPGRVVRGSPAGDPFGVGAVTEIDVRSVNLADAEVEAYDVAADYTWDTTAAGSFELYALATWQTHYKTRLTPVAPLIENVGITSSNPLKLKANAGLTWKRNSLSVGWVARYFDSYVVVTNPATTGLTTVLNQGGSSVPAQMYHDAFANYGFDDTTGSSILSRLLADSEITLGVKNVFNKSPPFDANAGDFFYSRFGDVHLASYYLTLEKNF